MRSHRLVFDPHTPGKGWPVFGQCVFCGGSFALRDGPDRFAALRRLGPCPKAPIPRAERNRRAAWQGRYRRRARLLGLPALR